MKKIVVLGLMCLLVFFGTVNADSSKGNNFIANGRIINGLRIFTSNDVESGKLLAFRGDYVRIEIGSDTVKEFSIDSLKIKHNFPKDKSGKKYFKLKKTGKFEYKFSDQKGFIEISEYKQANYKAVSADEGKETIKNISPFILDVRTSREYNFGHIEGAALMPVQVIQTEYKKLEQYKNSPVFIYCASGNRSTVASKILIEKGFSNIYNLRYGIKGWVRAGFKIVK